MVISIKAPTRKAEGFEGAGQSMESLWKQPHKKLSKAQEWIKFRVAYMAKHVKENGLYECMNCHRWIKSPEVDHVQRRGSHAELVFDESNLAILCNEAPNYCHARKDSGMVIK